jgi:hypothetical protein
LGPLGYGYFDLSLAFSFCLAGMVLTIDLLLDYCFHLVPQFRSRTSFTKQMPVQVTRISQLEPLGLTLQKGNLPPLVLTFEHVILVWHNFLEFSYQPYPGIKSNIDFWLVQGKSTPDIEIGINLVERLVLP